MAWYVTRYMKQPLGGSKSMPASQAKAIVRYVSAKLYQAERILPFGIRTYFPCKLGLASPVLASRPPLSFANTTAAFSQFFSQVIVIPYYTF